MPQADLAFVYVGRSSFVQCDEELLRKRYTLRPVAWRGKASIPALARAVAGSHASFSWFGADHAYGALRLGQLFRTPAMVVVGGLDASWVPELRQGVWGVPRLAARARALYRQAAAVLPVDESLAGDILEHTGHDGHNMATIPTGYDRAHFAPSGPKEPVVLTVADVSEATVARKGLDTFAEAARRVPEARFVLVGNCQDDAGERIRAAAPPNLTLTGRVSDAELLGWYRRAAVYCQLSRHEGLPNALCEAMLCACVPVGTPHYGIPRAIGDTGPIVPWRDAEATAQGVRAALGRDGHPARQRIARLFPLERREKQLLAAVEAVLQGEPPGPAVRRAWSPPPA